ncbi:MAG: putative TIM-barrel fold metal-dependent hydrolase [Halieaceae bacterium]|jgi:predicted TIM-barrel fold metal-dependent hydrolase
MSVFKDIEVIDLLLGIPNSEDRSDWYQSVAPLLMDEESRKMFKMPAQYMFKDIPDLSNTGDAIVYTLEQMDKHGISRAMLGVDDESPTHVTALKQHSQRFFAAYEANANRGMDEVRKIKRLFAEQDIKAVTAFPSGICPQVPINDKRWYPIYACCVELDIPFCPCVGVPGPRVPMEPQKVEHLDEVCWFFPELKIVMRHGAEPWTELAIKLMIKYPNLHYMTSAFAPKHYPKDIIEYANTRGGDKIMYAGYFPMALSLDRIFSEMENVPFREHVWPKFLNENARRVFKL